MYFLTHFFYSYHTYCEEKGSTFTDIFFLDAENGWIVGNSGNIFITHNAGQFWEKYKINTSKTLTSIKVMTSQEGWVFDGEKIYKSSDGGLSWSPLAPV